MNRFGLPLAVGLLLFTGTAEEPTGSSGEQRLEVGG